MYCEYVNGYKYENSLIHKPLRFHVDRLDHLCDFVEHVSVRAHKVQDRLELNLCKNMFTCVHHIFVVSKYIE